MPLQITVGKTSLTPISDDDLATIEGAWGNGVPGVEPALVAEFQDLIDTRLKHQQDIASGADKMAVISTFTPDQLDVAIAAVNLSKSGQGVGISQKLP